MKSLFRFGRRRWWVFGILLGSVYFLAFVGVWFMAIVPFQGTFLFVARLMLFLLPGIVFAWTGLFEFHEFGASPLGWPGYLVMVAFYAALALLIKLAVSRQVTPPQRDDAREWRLVLIVGAANALSRQLRRLPRATRTFCRHRGYGEK